MILNEVAKCLTRRSLLQHSAAIAAALAHPCMAASDNRSDRPPPTPPYKYCRQMAGFQSSGNVQLSDPCPPGFVLLCRGHSAKTRSN